jgi:hypothetical protein
MLELLLVGAGPQNLCLLLRLLDPAAAPADTVRRPPSSKTRVDQRAHRQVFRVSSPLPHFAACPKARIPPFRRP